MRVLGIDPGYDRVGVAIIDRDQNGAETLLYSACIETTRNTELSERLFIIGTTVKELIATHKPTLVAIETLFFNKNVKTAIGVAQARGAIMYIAKEAGCTLSELGPQEIKVAITGYGKSDKTAVIQMVKRLVKGAPENAIDDEYDAIAVGITALAHHRGQ
jgi:crossover junction endodeoxyribonuclease RuvC